MFVNDIKTHLNSVIIPYWESLKDNEQGGYYGLIDFNQKLDKKAIKGSILNARILWFFSNSYMALGDTELLNQANHAYKFLKDKFIDPINGGAYWALNYDGTVFDDTKHTYCQAFNLYALSSYYDITKNDDVLKLAMQLFDIIEEKCTDNFGYLEAFDREFKPASNEKLSENGIMAYRTMNTLLHIFEAYTELYRVTKNPKVEEKLKYILDIFIEKVYNPDLKRLEVFFDKDYNSIINLHSYGNDIETAWLLDRGCEILNDKYYTERIAPITKSLTKTIYQCAYKNNSLMAECEKGIDLTTRIWWVQAEAIIGFINGYQKDNSKVEYLKAGKNIWEYVKENVVDKRENSEWFSEVDKNGKPDSKKPMVDLWKCPYHNGRMCIEMIKRNVNV